MTPGINVVESPHPPAKRRVFMQRLIARIGSGAAEKGAAFAGAKCLPGGWEGFVWRGYVAHRRRVKPRRRRLRAKPLD